ncbi:uncharacterized protein Dere_GG12722 [Drosophila erecta]|uniref:Uncharacterized protein n=1 Tax=Drosophila erecta TaxID=7220 RepID=B3P9D1_DROER|nr:uncharacterized protein Dere_GG12722 [Drosophila erecta]
MSINKLLEPGDVIKQGATNITTDLKQPTACTFTSKSTSVSGKTTKNPSQPSKQESLLKKRNPVVPPILKSAQEMRADRRNPIVHDVMNWSPYSEKIQALVQSCAANQVVIQFWPT